MKPESSTRDKLKEYRSKQRQEISQKLAHSETYKVIGQMPPHALLTQPIITLEMKQQMKLNQKLPLAVSI